MIASDEELRAITDDKLLVMMARLDPRRAESLMDGYEGPVTLELVEFYSIYTENPSSLRELNSAARYLAFESNDPYRIRRACVHWLAKYEPGFLMDCWSVLKNAPPNTRLPGQGPMTQREFEHSFGPREIISLGESVTWPLLSESWTTWGWWPPGELETDWGARAEALSIATEMARHAREGGLLCRLRNSLIPTPYFPFAGRWSGSLDLEGFRTVLGLDNDESVPFFWSAKPRPVI